MKILSKVLCLLLALSMLLSMTACGEPSDGTQASTTGVTNNVERETYIVTVKSEGGMTLADIGVY